MTPGVERWAAARRVNTLTVHQVGLIVFNETQSLSDSKDSNESIDAAREKIAHAVIRGQAALPGASLAYSVGSLREFASDQEAAAPEAGLCEHL